METPPAARRDDADPDRAVEAEAADEDAAPPACLLI